MRKTYTKDKNDAPENARLITSNGFGGELVKLYELGKDNFTVQYGKERYEECTYGQAAKALGECIMHALCCASRMKDN